MNIVSALSLLEIKTKERDRVEREIELDNIFILERPLLLYRNFCTSFVLTSLHMRNWILREVYFDLFKLKSKTSRELRKNNFLSQEMLFDNEKELSNKINKKKELLCKGWFIIRANFIWPGWLLLCVMQWNLWLPSSSSVSIGNSSH